MKTGGSSNPSFRNPQLSATGLIGPRMRSMPRPASHRSVAASSARATTKSSVHSKAPKKPVRALYQSLKLWSTYTRLRPTILPSCSASSSVKSECDSTAFLPAR